MHGARYTFPLMGFTLVTVLIFQCSHAEVSYEIANAGIKDLAENKFDFFKLFIGSYYESIYDKINNYLIDNSPENDDPIENINLAAKWLVASKGNIFNKFLVDGLTQFTSLMNINEENRCNRNSYAILLKNDRATKGRTHHSPSKLGVLRRVDKVIYYYALQHAIGCQNVYPQTFVEKYAQLDEDSVRRVETFIDNLLQRKHTFFRRIQKSEKIGLATNIKSIRGKLNAETLYESLVTFSSNDPERKYLVKLVNERNGKLEVNKKGLTRLFRHHLIEPCEYYVKNLGPDIFIPAGYDVAMLEEDDRYNKEDSNLSEFLVGWARFRLCNLLISRDQNSLLADVFKIAERSSQMA